MVSLEYVLVSHDGRAIPEHGRLRLFLVPEEVIGGGAKGLQSTDERQLPLFHQLECGVEQGRGSDQFWNKYAQKIINWKVNFSRGTPLAVTKLSLWLSARSDALAIRPNKCYRNELSIADSSRGGIRQIYFLFC